MSDVVSPVQAVFTDVSNGVLGNLTTSQLTTKYGSGNIKTASKDFAFFHRGHVVFFQKNRPHFVTTDLAAALASASAPVAQMARKKQDTDPESIDVVQHELPAAIRLTFPYAYYENDGTLKNWTVGQVITDAPEIEHLHKRGAHYEPHGVGK